MSFSKFTNFSSQLVSKIFNDAHGAMWAMNGRLSGFYPTAVGGDIGSPGIVSADPSFGNTVRTITVNLKAPVPTDDLRFPATDLYPPSFCLANGVLLEAFDTTPLNLGVVLNLTMIDLGSPPLDDEIPIMIYAQYDDSANPPTFAAARENVIDQDPTDKAKLAFFDPIAKIWLPTPQISVGGIFQTSIDITSKYGGLLATRLDSGTLKVTPGTVVGSFGRITSSGIRLVPSLSFPATGLFRKDLLVITDPQSTTNELAQPTFTILRGTIESADVGVTTPPPITLDPKQVLLAEIMMSNTGIGQVIDIRPIMAWQTDSMMQSAPVALEKIDINTIQPGVILTDTTQNQPKGWGLVVFRLLNDSNNVVSGKSSMAIGIVGPMEPPFQFTATTTPFLPAQILFPPSPWILEDTFKVLRLSDGQDVAHDKDYFPPDGNPSFDFKRGIFVGQGITPPVATLPANFSVEYQHLKTIFVIDEDGTIHLPDLDAFFQHIRADNPAAHKAANIRYDNSVHKVPLTPPNTANITVQAAIESLTAAVIAPSVSSAVYLMPWRMYRATIPIYVAVNASSNPPVTLAGVPNYAFIGPSGYITAIQDPTFARLPDVNDDGIIFFPSSGTIKSVILSVVAQTWLANNVSTNWDFDIWGVAGIFASFSIQLTPLTSGNQRYLSGKYVIDSSAFIPPTTGLSIVSDTLYLSLKIPTFTQSVPPAADVLQPITLTMSLDFDFRLD